MDSRKLENQYIDFDKDPKSMELPNSVIQFPRFKIIPKNPPMSRWQKFAKSKGILNTKRSRLVYNEEIKDWVPRWGKGSAKKIKDNINGIMEIKGNNLNP